MPQVFPSSASIAGIWLWGHGIVRDFLPMGLAQNNDITETFFTPAKCVPADWICAKAASPLPSFGREWRKNDKFVTFVACMKASLKRLMLLPAPTAW